MVTAATLHPAQRRLVEAKIARPPDHKVLLRPLSSRSFESDGSPRTDMIFTSSEQKFFDALVADLQRPDWRVRLEAMRRYRIGEDKMLELNLPMHKRMQIVLFEAVCKRPGAPRLDPQQITSSGLVVRRLEKTDRLSWLKVDGRVVGWQAASEAADYDPDPLQRRSSHKANAAIRKAIAQRKGVEDDAKEDVTSLFVMPPEVCEARGRTVLFGVIPVTSTEAPEGPGPSIDFADLDDDDRKDIIDHFSAYLKPRPATPMPRADEMLSARWNALSDPRTGSGMPDPQLKAFGLFLHQLLSELDLFGKNAASQRLASTFAGIRLPLVKDEFGRVTEDRDALSFLRDAMRILIDATPEMLGQPAGAAMPTARMPLEWPRIDTSTGDALTQAALECLSSRHARVAPPEPRFHNDNSLYQVRGFLRLKGHGDCPEKIIWSDYSEPFRIVPWWDSDGPDVRISLPSMGKLRKARPNVTFDIPAPLGAVLSSDLKKLKDGEDPGSGIELGWLCSFSIPIITLCAFIVLHIFLGLLNIVFQWLLWVKVCIPIPKGKGGG